MVETEMITVSLLVDLGLKFMGEPRDDINNGVVVDSRQIYLASNENSL